jgi:hypothetical protein
VQIDNLSALGGDATNSITLSGGKLAMGAALTVPNNIILAAGANIIDIKTFDTTITPAITGTGTSLAIDATGAGANKVLTLAAGATHTAPTTLGAYVTVDINANNTTLSNLTSVDSTAIVQSASGTPVLTVPVTGTSDISYSGELASSIKGLVVYDVSTNYYFDISTCTNNVTGPVTVGNGTHDNAGGLSIGASGIGDNVTALTLAGGKLRSTTDNTLPAATLTHSSAIGVMGVYTATLSGAVTGPHNLSLLGDGTNIATFNAGNNFNSTTVTKLKLGNKTVLQLSGNQTLPAIEFTTSTVS